MTCQQTSTLGVYLLGALEPEERSTFESHLYGCDQCRAELVRLAPLPGLLNQIAVADFEEAVPAPDAPDIPEPQPAPVVDLPIAPAVVDEPDESDEPGEDTDGEMAGKPASRRPRWLITAAAAAVLALVFGGVLGWEALRSGGGGAQPHTVVWSAVDPVSGVHADVKLTERAWGTDIQLSMSNVSGTKRCRLVVKAKYGYRDKPDPYYETAGWWTYWDNADDGIPGSTSIDLASIYRLEVMDGDTMLVGITPKSS
jgi:hypothetical protein